MKAASAGSPWLLGTGSGAPLRLYCLCYAGGNAMAYLDWQAALAPHMDVRAIQLPGRGARFHETPLQRFDALIGILGQVLDDALRAEPAHPPFALFGHSLGALLAFELARRQAAHGVAAPDHVIVSGCAAPRHRPPPEGLHLLDDAGLTRRLQELNGTPPEILAHAELMAVLLPTIRADMALVDDYVYRPGPPLAMPLTVLAGRDDDFDSPEQTTGWADETAGPCSTHWFDGDHFFINSAQAAVLARLRQALGVRECAPAAASAPPPSDPASVPRPAASVP